MIFIERININHMGKSKTEYDDELKAYFDAGYKAWTAYTMLNVRFRANGAKDVLSYNTVQAKYKKWRDRYKPHLKPEHELPDEILRKKLFSRKKKTND